MYTTPISLLQRLQRPDNQQAWQRFVALYSPLLFLWARRLGLQPHDAADLVQEVLARLFQKLPQFAYDPNRSFRGWLRTVMHNAWRNSQRRRVLPTANPVDLENLTDDDNMDVFSDQDYRRHLLGRALQLMQTDFQPTTWKAFQEHAVAGRPAAEVAAELGISTGAVQAGKFRVLCRLRQELQGLLD